MAMGASLGGAERRSNPVLPIETGATPHCFPGLRRGRNDEEEQEPMSIRKMIGLHPASAQHHNVALGDAVHHLMYCAKMCLSCADSCMAEPMDMTQCIRLCLDCSDICDATGRVALRKTGDDRGTLVELLELCARICDACATECEKHDHEHCRLCAQICRECAEDCRNAAQSVMEPA